jgi:glycosyltransferase involved in cell wall biosynthesis
MIEAMACGTPVLALRRGSVEEVVISAPRMES